MSKDRRSHFNFQISLGSLLQMMITVVGFSGLYYNIKADVSLIKQEQQYTKSYLNDMKDGFKEFRNDVSLWENDKNIDITRLKADVDNLKATDKKSR